MQIRQRVTASTLRAAKSLLRNTFAWYHAAKRIFDCIYYALTHMASLIWMHSTKQKFNIANWIWFRNMRSRNVIQCFVSMCVCFCRGKNFASTWYVPLDARSRVTHQYILCMYVVRYVTKYGEKPRKTLAMSLNKALDITAATTQAQQKNDHRFWASDDAADVVCASSVLPTNQPNPNQPPSHRCDTLWIVSNDVSSIQCTTNVIWWTVLYTYIQHNISEHRFPSMRARHSTRTIADENVRHSVFGWRADHSGNNYCRWQLCYRPTQQIILRPNPTRPNIWLAVCLPSRSVFCVKICFTSILPRYQNMERLIAWLFQSYAISICSGIHANAYERRIVTYNGRNIGMSRMSSEICGLNGNVPNVFWCFLSRE